MSVSRSWEGYVTDVQRLKVRRLITVLTLTQGNMKRPDRQLIVVEEQEELAARMFPGNLVAAVVSVLNDTGKLALCVGDFSVVKGLTLPEPIKPSSLDKAALIVLAQV